MAYFGGVCLWGADDFVAQKEFPYGNGIHALAWSPDSDIVRVEAAVAGDHIDIRVVDRGPGIPMEQREHVFEPFQRLGDARGARQSRAQSACRYFPQPVRGLSLLPPQTGPAAG